MAEFSVETGSSVLLSGTNPMRSSNQQKIGEALVASSSAAETEVPELPLNWEEISGTDNTAVYYWNTVTNETQYKRPLH